MTQRDYEEQPEAPDLASVLQQDTAESLTGPAGEVDPLDAGYAPPDRPYALDDDQVTVEGQREGETLDERLAAEVPEDVPVDVDRAGRLADPGSEGALERSDDMVGDDVGIDGGAASAEEAAVHVVDLAGRAPTDDDAAVADEVAAETPAGDPDVDAARVDAARDMRATDEGSAPVDRG